MKYRNIEYDERLIENIKSYLEITKNEETIVFINDDGSINETSVSVARNLLKEVLKTFVEGEENDK
jgi:hypothetical protein